MTTAAIPARLPDGVYCIEGSFILPTSLRMAYKLWSNAPEGLQLNTATVTGSAHRRSDNVLNILAVHGRHDNAASWDRLAPLLLSSLFRSSSSPPSPPSSPSTASATASRRPPLVRFLAIDLAGHGHSSWRPSDGSYAFLYFVRDLHILLTRVLQWSEVVLCGHSVGALVVGMLAGSYGRMLPVENRRRHAKKAGETSITTANSPPSSPSSLAPSTPTLHTVHCPPLLLGCIMLDPFHYETWHQPSFTSLSQYIQYHDNPPLVDMIHVLRQRAKKQGRKRRVYRSVDEAVAAYRSKVPGIDESSVRILLERGLQPVTELSTDIQSLDPHAPGASPSFQHHPQSTQMNPATSSDPSSSPINEPSSIPSTSDSAASPTGYIFRHDPLLSVPPLIDTTLSQMSSFFSSIRCRHSLLIHVRNEEISGNTAWIEFVDDVLFEGSIFNRKRSQLCSTHPPPVPTSAASSPSSSFPSPCSTRPIDPLHEGAHASTIDVSGKAAGHHVHLDAPHSNEVLPHLVHLVENAWIDRAATRRHEVVAHQLVHREREHQRELIRQRERMLNERYQMEQQGRLQLQQGRQKQSTQTTPPLSASLTVHELVQQLKSSNVNVASMMDRSSSYPSRQPVLHSSL